MKRFFWLAVVLLFFASFFLLSRVYAYLAAAFTLAYLLEPLVTQLERRGVPRTLADVTVLIGFFSGLTGFVIIAVPLLLEQGRELIHRAPVLFNAGQVFLNRILSTEIAKTAAGFLGLDLSAPFTVQAADTVGAAPGASAAPMLGVIFRSTIATMGFLTNILGLFIIPLLTFHLMRDFPTLTKRLLRIVPRGYHRVFLDLQDRLNAVMGGFLRGQLLVATILASFYSAGFLLLRVDLGFVLGVLSGYMTLVPYLGIMTMISLTFLIAILHGAAAGKLIGIAIVYACGVVGEGFFLTPNIVGGRVGLSPLTVLIAIMSGAELLGIRGVLIAIPAAAAIKVVFEYNLEKNARQIK